MRLLKDILYKSGAVELYGSTNLAVLNISADSRADLNNGLFIAVKGTLTDGHEYIDKAIDSGAIAIVCENLPPELNEKITYVKVKDSSLALGMIASNFHDNPSASLKVIGVTGTNGKTTTTTLLFDLFRKLGNKCGLISTVKNQIEEEVIPSSHTTPDPIQLQRLFSRMKKAGCTHVFMEVSSHAIDQKRIAGTEFTLGIFTNITHDHLDYHKTFENYIIAKQQFFSGLSSSATALVNSDDQHGMEMAENSKAKVHTYGLSKGADFTCRVLEKQLNGTLLLINDVEVWTQLIGNFNAYNLLAVYASAIILGYEKDEVLTQISTLRSVEGRFQSLRSPNNITAIVDYAHTPDALKNILSTINELRTGNEQVITVIGCGGDRDKSKRPEMARIAAELSNLVVLTSDNPRSEKPEEIILQMKAGVDASNFRKAISITDRREAIQTAFNLSKPGDIVLVAGKGHEKYQEINGVKYPFDDWEEIKESFQKLQN